MKRHADNPVTIAYLNRYGFALDLHCRTCGRCRRVKDFGFLKLDPRTTVMDIPRIRRLRCRKCSSRDVVTRPGYPGGYDTWPEMVPD